MSGEGTPRILGLCGLAGLAVTLWNAPATAGIASDWAAMSGGLEAKVVYFDANTKALSVMNLSNGSVMQIWASGDYSYHKNPCWSPDGTRIYVRSNAKAMVMNADGTKRETVTTYNCTYGGNSWWNDDWIVVVNKDANHEIRRVEVDADNLYVSEVTVVDDIVSPLEGDERSFASMSGNYVAWWESLANVSYGGYHRDVVLNWVTKDRHECRPRDDHNGGCNINLKRDGSGTYVFNYPTHTGPAPIETFDGTKIGEIAPVLGGQTYLNRWSPHENFIIHKDGNSVDTFRRSFVRKVSDGSYVNLGAGVCDADLWVQTNTITVTNPNGGETWTGKGTEDVTWTTTGTVGDVKIELSTDGGASWTTLVADTANNGTEPVTLPDVQSTQCRIRVSELDGSPKDASDADFAIVWADTDGDLIPDWWEEEHFSGPTGCVASEDTDNDGLDNLEEYQAGTDPHEEDTDGDGIKDGDDPRPLTPPFPLTGGCSSGGAALPLAVALFWLATRLRGREAAVQ